MQGEARAAAARAEAADAEVQALEQLLAAARVGGWAGRLGAGAVLCWCCGICTGRGTAEAAGRPGHIHSQYPKPESSSLMPCTPDHPSLPTCSLS